MAMTLIPITIVKQTNQQVQRVVSRVEFDTSFAINGMYFYISIFSLYFSQLDFLLFGMLSFLKALC